MELIISQEETSKKAYQINPLQGRALTIISGLKCSTNIFMAANLLPGSDLFMNCRFLVIVKAHTKWLDIHATSFTAAVIIEKLQRTFATLDHLKTLVSDNGSPFTSHQFTKLMRVNGISHLHSSPYHSSSNQLVE